MVIFLTSGALFGLSYLTFRRGQYLWALVTLMLLGLILRLYVGADSYLHEWDERYHALVAKHLMDDPFRPMLYQTPLLDYDYRSWASNHIWLHKQPVPLWLMAGSMSLFGVNELALRLPSILLSTLAIGATYSIGRSLFNHRLAFWAAFFHSIHGLSIELAAGRVATDHIDASFQAWVVFSVAFAVCHVQRQHFLFLVGMAFCCACAILSKWLPALIVWPLWGVLQYARQRFHWRAFIRDSLLFGSMVFLLVAPWQMWIYQQFPQEAAWESAHQQRHIFEGLDGHGQPFYYHLFKMGMLYGELIYLPLIWLIWRAINQREERYIFLLLWIGIPLVFFSYVQTKMQGYLIFTATAYFLLNALALEKWLPSLRQQKQWRFPATLLGVLLVLLPIRYSIERVKPFTAVERHPAWVTALKDLRTTLDPTQRYVILDEDHAIEAMFYLDMVVAYAFTPSPTSIQAIQKAGYHVLRKQSQEGKIQYIPF